MLHPKDISAGTLRGLLGIGQGRELEASVLSETASGGILRRDLRLSGIPATMLRPAAAAGPMPAVLFCHAHGGDHARGRRELTEGARWLAGPYGPDLASRGYAVLCIDMPGFGDRRSEGAESALAKAGIWRGRPLFGQMLADLLAARAWLAAEPGIDASRVAALGASMGGALALWLAALEPRIAAVAHLCTLADLDPLIRAGAHDRHGLYLLVPGLLERCDIGDIAALVAPRPQFVALGEDDALTPPAARDPALARLAAAYASAPGGLARFMAPRTGHVETPAMRRAVLDFLQRRLMAGRHLDSDERMPT